MIPSLVMKKFREVTDVFKADIYLGHLANLHGPYEVIEPRLQYTNRGLQEVNDVTYKCLACNTIWPCVTFTVLEDKSTAMRNN